MWSEDGVLVLMDLGSAVLSAELALDLLDEERRARVLLTAAPLVEGAVAAAVAAGLGDPLEAVAAAARGGLAGKASHLGEGGDSRDALPRLAAPARRVGAAGAPGRPARQTPAGRSRVTVLNPLGLHARPAALLVRTAAGFDARVEVTDATTGRGPVSARSLNGVATLGARQGDELVADGVGSAGGGGAGRRPPPRRGRVRRARADLGAGLRRPTRRPPRPRPGRSGRRRPRPPRRRRRGARRAARGAGSGRGTGAARSAAPRGPLPTRPAADPAAEWAALERALSATAADIRAAQASVAGRAGARDAAIFDAHLLFLEDEALLGPAHDGVFARREPAARAWAEAVDRGGGRLGQRWRTRTSARAPPTCAPWATRSSPT